VILEAIPEIVQWALLFFVFTIPFEAAQTAFTSGSLSLAKLSGLLFAGIFIYHYNPLHRPGALLQLSTPARCFLGYLVVYLFHGLLIPTEYFDPFLTRLFTLAQLIVLFCMTSFLLQNPRMSHRAIFAYTLAAGILALCTLFQVPVFSDTVIGPGDGRLTALGENPNTIGQLMATGLVALIGLVLLQRWNRATMLLLHFSLPLLIVLVRSGSRASMMAFALGSLVYLFRFWSGKNRVWTVLLSTAAIVALIYVVVNDPVSSRRMESTYYGYQVAGRDIIFATAIEMITERPFMGWHPVLHWYELGLRVGDWYKDAHNLLLHLLLEVGLFGAVPFIVGLAICFHGAWTASKGNLGLIVFALLIVTLAFTLANTGLATKPLWLVLALSAGAAAAVRKTQEQVSMRRVAVCRTPNRRPGSPSDGLGLLEKDA
jgi:O-antigen ligase